MKCDDYKQAIEQEPAGGFVGEREHAEACVACSDYRTTVRALDRRIVKALAIDVPALVLPALDDNVVPLSRTKVWQNPAWLGLAASFALIAVFAVNWLQPGSPPQTLAEQIVAHLDHELGSLVVTDVAVSDRRLKAAARPALVDMDRSIGLISYAMNCTINGHEVPHLVVQGVEGPVTILLMPHEQVAQAVPLLGQSIEGVILPVGEGSVAIIGTRGEALDHWQQQVMEKVHWKT